MMRIWLNFLAAVVAISLFLLGTAIFTVDQRQYAIVFQLGEVRRVINEAGLYFKWPIIQNVRYFDKRIMTMDSDDSARVLTSEKKNVYVDYFVKWRIVDPQEFYIRVAGEETQARLRLQQIITAGMYAEFGKRTVHDVVSGERDVVMAQISETARGPSREIGVEIVDVRIKRVELPPEVSVNVYRRMEAERKRVANELRSEGAAEAERIRAEADRQREVIVAEAFRDAQKIKGEGDARATAIYAQAFRQNPEFYTFYRSMEAYRNSFNQKSDIFVVGPHSSFFNYMNSQRGGERPRR